MNATANTSRRNGKPASCEPCRINKTRCDHGMPKCDRCKQRGIEDRCFYHPAPLTKPRPVPDGTGAGESRPLKRKRPSKPSNTEAVFPGTAGSPGEKLADAVAADVYHPGFLGPGSFAVLLPQDEESSIPQEREISVASERSDRELSHQHPLTKSMRYQMASDVLSVFRHYTAIRELVLWYNSVNEAGVVPAQLQVDAVNAIEALVDKHNLRRAPPSPQLILQVLESTSRPFTISHSLEARDFHILYSGDNLRFETIGFLLATAGRSLTFGFAPDLFSDQSKMAVNKSQFADELLRGSTTCLFLCTMLATANDITIWMYYENYLFTTMICGYAGPPSWRRIGELSTQIYALGIHKESTSTNIPVWLRETRRRLFCSAYNQDKSISTFLGRPIRISKRYADVSLPLDVSDEEMMQDPSTLQEAIDALDKDGWNTKGRWLRSSWIRLRHTSLRFREEVLEFSLMKIDQSAELQLLDISNRIRSSWDSLPAHMRYWKSCWDEGVPSTVCLMLIIVHLTHWYNEFMIQKLLDYRPLTANTGLLRVSVELLSNVLALGTIRDRSYDVHRDLLHCILLFGVPAASVLATALREQHSTAQSFPHGISRSEIVRMLSVLISHLDAAAHGENGGARQGEANYNLCRKASRIFTKVIDTVLDARNATGSEATPTSENMGVDFNFDMFSGPGLDGFESLEFSGLGPLGLSGAGNSGPGVGNGGVEGSGIDWGQIGQWSL